MDTIIRVTLLYQVIVGLLPTQASDLQLCGSNTEEYDLTSIKSQNHDLEDGRVFNLFQSQTALNWCQARQACRQEGLNLATIESQDTYISVKKLALDSALAVDVAWLSGSRKESGWTWVTDSLPKCRGDVGRFNCSRTYRTGVEYGTVTIDILDHGLKQSAYFSVIDAGVPYICTIDKEVQVFTTGETSWYDAQNACVIKGGRLATYDESVLYANKHGNPNAPSHWNGLQYNPWVWVADDGDEQIMYYSTFAVDGILSAAGGKQCVGARLTSGLHWVQVGCESKLNYLICQNKASTSAALSWWVILIIVVVGFIIMLILIVWLRGKCAKDPLDPDAEEAVEAMTVTPRKGSDNDGKSEGTRQNIGKDQITMVKLHATTADLDNPDPPVDKRKNGVTWNHYVRSTSQPDSPSSQLIPSCPDPESNRPLPPSAPAMYSTPNKSRDPDTTVVIENTNCDPSEEPNQDLDSSKENNNFYNEVETLPLLNSGDKPDTPQDSTDNPGTHSADSPTERSPKKGPPKLPPPKPSRLLQPTRPAPGQPHSNNIGAKAKKPKPQLPPKPKASALKQ